MKALHMAAAVGNINIVHFLVSMGISVNDPENGNHLPLHEAIMNNRLRIVEYLVDEGADVKALGDGEATMMHYTANYSDNIDIAQTLIGAGALVDKADFAGVTPLHCASRCNWIDMVKLLCQNGANPESKDVQGMTPLHKSAEAGSVHCARYLIVEQNVPVDCVTNAGISPYAFSLKYAKNEIAELILSAGYVPTSKDLEFGLETVDDQNPRFMHRNEEVHKKLITVTKNLLSTVPSLSDRSIYTIRKHLGRKGLTNVNRLQIPTAMKDQICMVHLQRQV